MDEEALSDDAQECGTNPGEPNGEVSSTGSDSEVSPRRRELSEQNLRNLQAGLQVLADRLADQPLPDISGLLPAFETIREKLTRSMDGVDLNAMSRMLEQLQTLDLVVPRLAGDTEPEGYSDHFHSPRDYFHARELEVNSFEDLHKAIQSLNSRNPSLDFLWRGQQNSDWGLHSSLYRTLIEVSEVRPASEPHRQVELYPTENDVVRAEKKILELARKEWRLDNLSALEIFARLQHYGAPTRLIDVSRNPYVAVWFAVEKNDAQDENDARIFAAATHPVLSPEREKEAKEIARLNGELANKREPFWHDLSNSEQRTEGQWGTGTIRRYWVPPLYEQRILAQNGGFLLDGVPLNLTKNARLLSSDKEKVWNKADILASASIYTRLYSPRTRVKENRERSFPATFTFRISAAAKQEIRNELENRLYYSAATLYPDVEGLARYVKPMLRELFVSRPASS